MGGPNSTHAHSNYLTNKYGITPRESVKRRIRYNRIAEQRNKGITFNWPEMKIGLSFANTARAIAIHRGSSVTVVCCRGTMNIWQTLNSCSKARTKERREGT